MLSDATCDRHYAETSGESGSSGSSKLHATVLDAKASFVFGLGSTTVNALNEPAMASDFTLCYKFAGEDFKLYASLPIFDERKAARLLGDYSDTFLNLRANLKLSLTTLRNDPVTDLDYYPQGSSERAAFILSFRRDISRALNIRIERIRVSLCREDQSSWNLLLTLSA